MMIKSLDSFSESLKKFIEKSYATGHSLEDLQAVTGIDRNILITILAERGVEVHYRELPSFKLDGDKLLIIADTHIGSMYENRKYLDETYEFGVKEGVCGCIHLGDLVQGMYDKTAYGTDEQMKFISEKYPEPSEFDTYVVLGNHDYGVFNPSDCYKKVLDSKKGLNVVGYKKAYFEWCRYMYSMEHKIKQLDIFIPERPNMLTLVGHGHELKIKSANRLKVPTLSDDIMSKNQGQVPGFLLAEQTETGISIDSYDFDDNSKPKIRAKAYLTRNRKNDFKVK